MGRTKSWSRRESRSCLLRLEVESTLPCALRVSVFEHEGRQVGPVRDERIVGIELFIDGDASKMRSIRSISCT